MLAMAKQEKRESAGPAQRNYHRPPQGGGRAVDKRHIGWLALAGPAHTSCVERPWRRIMRTYSVHIRRHGLDLDRENHEASLRGVDLDAHDACAQISRFPGVLRTFPIDEGGGGAYVRASCWTGFV